MEIVDFGHAQGPDEIIKERLKIFPPLSPDSLLPKPTRLGHHAAGLRIFLAHERKFFLVQAIFLVIFFGL